jgi:hypothetical protein
VEEEVGSAIRAKGEGRKITRLEVKGRGEPQFYEVPEHLPSTWLKPLDSRARCVYSISYC